ncbi:hypothetical protein EBS02_11505 [bacterium]|nr:hypothetical protein [bacterium]
MYIQIWNDDSFFLVLPIERRMSCPPNYSAINYSRSFGSASSQVEKLVQQVFPESPFCARIERSNTDTNAMLSFAFRKPEKSDCLLGTNFQRQFIEKLNGMVPPPETVNIKDWVRSEKKSSDDNKTWCTYSGSME